MDSSKTQQAGCFNGVPSGVELLSGDNVGLLREEEKVVGTMSSYSPCSQRPLTFGDHLCESSSIAAERKNGGVEKSECDSIDFPTSFLLNNLSLEDASDGDAACRVERFNNSIKYLSYLNIWSNQDTLPYDMYPSHTPSSPGGFSNPATPDYTMNSMISPYAQAGSGVEEIGAMMSGLRLGDQSTPSASFNSFTQSFGGYALGGRMGSYADIDWRLEARPAPAISCLSLADTSSSSNGLNWTDKNSNAGKFRNIMADENGAYTDVIFEAVVKDVFTVITNKYGQKLFRSLLRFCDPNQKNFLLATIVSNPLGVIFCSRTFYGSKSLIELVDCLKRSDSELVPQLPSILALDIKSLVFDCYASSLIKRCLTVLSPEQCESLYDSMIECALSLAVDTHSCVMLYILLENVEGIRRARLHDILAGCSVQLAIHPTGNYFVSHLLELKECRVTMTISSILFGYYKTLAMDRHGSHVVEKCIQSVGIDYVMNEFLNNSTKQELEEVACHEFGNYVIKMALKITEDYGKEYHGKLVKALLPGLARLKESQFGKVLYNKLKNEALRKNGRGKNQ
ncbi:hypothetical protein QQ045_009789 [Rhodiola kirilowii]